MQSYRDPTASESYVALRNALIAIGGDISAVRSILSSRSDNGAGWVQIAYCELRRVLVQGRLAEAETIGKLIALILDSQAEDHADEFSDNQLHKEAMRWLSAGIEAILAQDNLSGMKHLERLTEAVYCSESLQWVAWYWLAKAAADEGDLDAATTSAVRAVEIGGRIDAQAEGASLCLRGEIELLRGDLDAAQVTLRNATRSFESTDDRRGLAQALLNLARLLLRMEKEDEADSVARTAQSADPDWEEPAVFLSQRALCRGQIEEAEELVRHYLTSDPVPPEIKRQQGLIKYVRRHKHGPRAVADYVRLRELPPGEATVAEMEALWRSYPDFIQARELLAWSLIKIGKEQGAGEHFRQMATQSLDPELQSSVLLGLGCLANRQYSHRQPAKRVQEASSSFLPRALEIIAAAEDDDDIQVFEVTPLPVSALSVDREGQAAPSRRAAVQFDSAEYPEIQVIEAIPEDEARPAASRPQPSAAIAGAPHVDGAFVEFLDDQGTHELDVVQALDASFGFASSAGEMTPAAAPAATTTVAQSAVTVLPPLFIAPDKTRTTPAPETRRIRTPTADPDAELSFEDVLFASTTVALSSSSSTAELRAQQAAPAPPGPAQLSAPSRADGTARASGGSAPVLKARSNSAPSTTSTKSKGSTGNHSVVPGAAARAVFTGDLQLFAVPDLLDFMESSRRTGTLVITSEAGIGAVHLHQGRVTGAASPHSSNLGDLLVQKGALTPAQLESAIARQRDGAQDQLLGAVMVQMKLLDRGKLEEALLEQVKSALKEILEWTAGRFAFEPDKRDPKISAQEAEIELDTRGILLDVLREFDEANK